jgi:hypothetical protein
MDKQDSIGKMRLSASELMKYIFDKGDETREKSCGLQHIFVVVHSTKMKSY